MDTGNPVIYDRVAYMAKVTFILLIIIGAVGYWVYSCDDCEARGGVLVHGVGGGYECVPAAPPR